MDTKYNEKLDVIKISDLLLKTHLGYFHNKIIRILLMYSNNCFHLKDLK